MFILVAFSLIASAAAQGKYCCSPEQWEGTLGIVQGQTWKDGSGHYLEGSIHMSYDGQQKLIAMNQAMLFDGKLINNKILYDYNNGVMYTSNTGSCNATSLELEEWVGGCIPDNASETKNVLFGLGGLKTNSYHITLPTMEIYLSVTADLCVPVFETVHGTTPEGVSFIQTVAMTNIKAGIADRSVFAAPLSCPVPPRPTNLGPPPPGVGRRSLFTV